MEKKGIEFIFNEGEGKGATLEINGLADEEIVYAIGMLAMTLEERSGISQRKWLSMISDTNEAIRE
jgi:hypothetical protein